MKNIEAGKKIKEIRLRSALSQDELAEISQLSLRTVQRIENGETVPRGDSLKRISRALNISVDELTVSIQKDFPKLKLPEDKWALLLLHFSVFGFLIFPVLGIIFPMLIWSFFKTKIKDVCETGKKVMKSQIYWCSILYIVYAYTFALKSVNFNLPAPSNPKTIILIIAALYIYNTIDVLINIFRCSMIKRSIYKPGFNLQP